METLLSAGTIPTSSNTATTSHLLPQSSAPVATLPQLLSQPQPVAMPQFILTSGQLVQGIQGAQLLIPTSQGEHQYVCASYHTEINFTTTLSLHYIQVVRWVKWDQRSARFAPPPISTSLSQTAMNLAACSHGRGQTLQLISMYN